MSENCKSLVLQDKCNIEIFLSADPILNSVCEDCCGLVVVFDFRLKGPWFEIHMIIGLDKQKFSG